MKQKKLSKLYGLLNELIKDTESDEELSDQVLLFVAYETMERVEMLIVEGSNDA